MKRIAHYAFESFKAKEELAVAAITLGIAFIGIFGVYLAFASDGSGTASVSPSIVLAGSTGNTLTFTYTATESMNSGGITLTVPSDWSTPQGTSGTAGYTTVSTTGVVGSVFDEADSITGWTHNASNPTACSGGFSASTATKHSGTASIKCINSNDDNNGLWYKTITAQDWSSYATIGFWINSSAAIDNGDLKFDYSAATDLSNPIGSLSLGTAIPANTWTYVSFNFGTSTRTSIRSYGLHIANLSSMKNATVYLDSFSIGASSAIVPTFSGNDITVSAISLTNGQTITVTYGSGGGSGGAVAPASAATSTFAVSSKTVDSGSLTGISSSPAVTVAARPTMSSVSIASNNASTTLAKTGDIVTLSFTADKAVQTPAVTIAGHAASATAGTGNSFTASYAMATGDTEQVVPFTINATSTQGYSLAATATSTTNGTSVLFDKTAPTNQNTVFATSTTKRANASTTVVSSGTASNTIWFAPSGTTSFLAGSTMTTAGGTATSLLAPATAGTYKLFVIDAAGNVSTASTATLTVDTATPTLTSVTMSSNNASTTLAKTGDIATIAITASENINTPTVTIGAESGGSMHVSQGADAAHWTATTTLTSSDADGSMPFTINFSDVPGNTGTQVTAVTSGAGITFDKTVPTLSSVSLSSNNASTTNAKTGDTVTLSFSASEAVSVPTVAFTSGGIAITNSVTVTNTSGNAWTATYVTNIGDATGTVAFSVSGYHDAAGNAGTTITSGSGSVTFDKTAPTLSLTSSASSTTGISPIPVTAVFSETVTGFGTDDITVGNGMAQNLTGSGSSYSFDVVPSGNGTVTVDVASGAAQDAAGNASTAATQLSRMFSSLRPTVALTSASTTARTAPIRVTATFSASVTGFDAGDLIGRVTNGTTTNFSGEGSAYSFDITPTADGTVSLSIAESSAVDAATGENGNFASPTLSIAYDSTAPTLAEITPVSTPRASASATYVFSTNEAGSITYGGGCSGTPSSASSSGNVTVTFTGLSEGAHSCTATITDAAGNVSTTLTATPFTVDTTAPGISSVDADRTTSGATVTWTTNEAASSAVTYGLTSSYNATTTEADIATRVTAHSVALTGLVSCATYHYHAISKDAAGNTGVSADATFTTKGCAGNANVKSQSAHGVSRSAGGTIAQTSETTGLTLTIPAAFASADADPQFQIKQLDKAVAIEAIGSPSGYQIAGDHVYDLHSLVDNSTAITSFAKELTVTLNYNADDFAGIDESTLKVFRNDDGVWTELSNCSVDRSAKSVTCETDHFSTFAIFGQATQSDAQATAGSTGGSGSGTRAVTPVAMPVSNAPAKERAPSPEIKACVPYLSHYIRQGRKNDKDEVLKLQRFLRDNESAPGISETGTYGPRTVAAVVAFQEKYRNEILAPWNETKGSGYVYKTTLKKINALYCSAQ